MDPANTSEPVPSAPCPIAHIRYLVVEHRVFHNPIIRRGSQPHRWLPMVVVSSIIHTHQMRYGLFLDHSEIIAAERQGNNVRHHDTSRHFVRKDLPEKPMQTVPLVLLFLLRAETMDVFRFPIVCVKNKTPDASFSSPFFSFLSITHFRKWEYVYKFALVE